MSVYYTLVDFIKYQSLVAKYEVISVSYFIPYIWSKPSRKLKKKQILNQDTQDIIKIKA